MQLKSLLAAAERVAVDLLLDLVRGIRHVDGRVGVGRAHLAAHACQGSQELGVYEGNLGRGLPHAGAVLAHETEVRVLVDGARNKARHGGEPGGAVAIAAV